MTGADFVTFRQRLNADCESELLRKGPDYCHEDDRCENFKEVARAWGMTPVQVWAVYLAKHLSAIQRWVKQGRLSSETLRGRFIDARNYLDLGMALIDDVAPTEPPPAAEASAATEDAGPNEATIYAE